ncbi:MAG: hypothetical protein SVZ03_16475 [Spirochaetota bacterium]|nr:hypothetical protein [Spirochaetota bacterium]
MIVIHNAHINEDKTGLLPIAEYSILLMYSTDGKYYSVAEIDQILNDTGFIDVTCTSTTVYWSVITAIKPD